MEHHFVNNLTKYIGKYFKYVPDVADVPDFRNVFLFKSQPDSSYFPSKLLLKSAIELFSRSH